MSQGLESGRLCTLQGCDGKSVSEAAVPPHLLLSHRSWFTVSWGVYALGVLRRSLPLHLQVVPHVMYSLSGIHVAHR